MDIKSLLAHLSLPILGGLCCLGMIAALIIPLGARILFHFLGGAHSAGQADELPPWRPGRSWDDRLHSGHHGNDEL